MSELNIKDYINRELSLSDREIALKFFRFLEEGDGYEYIRLEVEKDNEKALKLYSLLGYKDCEYLPLYKKTKKRG